MGKQVLLDYLENKKPLVEFSLVPQNLNDCESLEKDLNALAEDFHVYPHWGASLPETKHLKFLEGQATKEALERLFGWRLVRERISPASDTFLWKEVNRPTRWPEGFEERIETIGLSQPGQYDDGQPFE